MIFDINISLSLRAKYIHDMFCTFHLLIIAYQSQSMNESMNQWITHSLTHSLTHHSLARSLARSLPHSLTHSINQSINHLINQTENKDKTTTWKRTFICTLYIILTLTFIFLPKWIRSKMCTMSVRKHYDY